MYKARSPSLKLRMRNSSVRSRSMILTATILISLLLATTSTIVHGETYTFVSKWGSFGSDDGQFNVNGPCGVAIDSAGYVYISDYGNNRIQKFTSDGVFVSKWGSFGSDDGQFNGPSGVAVDGADNVYVADLNDRIQKFTSDGVFVSKWGSTGAGDGQFRCPQGLAVDGLGNVYVVDSNNDRVQKFTDNGVFVSKWGSHGSGDGELSFPLDAAVDSAGYVYISDQYNHRVQKYTSDGVFVSKWGSFGSDDGQFNGPGGVAVDDAGYVYAVDRNNNRVQKFTSSGAFVSKWGSFGSDDGQLKWALDLAVDNAGYVYVADQQNNRVQKFSPPTISDIGSAGVWIGLKNSDDIGIRFDLKAEIYKDGVLVGLGQLDSVKGGSSGFNNAKLNSIPLSLIESTPVSAGDTLTIKLYVRNAAVGSGKNSGTARLWYNDAQADSHFDATIGETPTSYYLLDGFALGTAPGAGPRKTIDVAAGAKGSPFKLFGEWSIFIP